MFGDEQLEQLVEKKCKKRTNKKEWITNNTTATISSYLIPVLKFGIQPHINNKSLYLTNYLINEKETRVFCNWYSCGFLESSWRKCTTIGCGCRMGPSI